MHKQDLNGTRNRQCFFFAGFLAFCLFSCNTFKSDLSIQPGKRFELGGNRNGSFTVQLRNNGNVPVSVAERRANGQSVELGIFSPGDLQSVRFSAGSTALIDNVSEKPARLSLTVSGDKNLNMAERGN